MDISGADLDEHCYLNTMQEGKATFSILDQKRESKWLEYFKNNAISHQTKTSFTHWNTTLLKDWTLVEEMLT